MNVFVGYKQSGSNWLSPFAIEVVLHSHWDELQVCPYCGNKFRRVRTGFDWCSPLCRRLANEENAEQKGGMSR